MVIALKAKNLPIYYNVKCVMKFILKRDNIKYIIDECDQLQRILYGLKYYAFLKLDEIASNNDIFLSFCEIVYKQLINDYQHIISHHSDDLEKINTQIINDKNFGDCNHLKCISFRRYYNDSRRRSNENNADYDDDEKTDRKLLFYQEIFDNIHHWLFHLFHVGLRTKKKDLVENDDDDDDDDMKDSNEYIDIQFKRIRNNIQTKRNKLNLDIDSIQSSSKNKFTLHTTDGTNTNEKQKSNDDQTFIDILFNHLKDRDVSKEIRNKIKINFEEEEFDTDSLKEDVMDYQNGSNIHETINDEATIKLMVEEIAFYKSYIYFYIFIYTHQ